MTTIASMRAKLSLESRSFSSGLRVASKGVGGFVGRVKAASKSVMGLGTVFTGIAVGGGMAAFMKSQMESVDAMAKFSDRLGIDIRQLQHLRHAADQTGAGADTMNAGLATLAKRLGEAARGAGAAKPALEELGLMAGDLAAMGPGQAFYKIAEAMKKIEAPGKRAAIAANLFSKANMSLLNTLDLGTEGLEAEAKELESLGGTVSRIEAQRIEDANDALDNLGKTVVAVARDLASDLAPEIELFTKALSGLPDWIHGVEVAMYKLLYVTARTQQVLRGDIFRSDEIDAFVLKSRIGLAALEIEKASRGVSTVTDQGAPSAVVAISESLVDATQQAEKLQASLEFEIRAFGLSSMVQQIMRLREAGVDPGMITKLEALHAKLGAQQKAVKEQESLASQVEALKLQFETPFEQAQRRMEEIARLFMTPGGIDQQTFLRAYGGIMGDYRQSFWQQQPSALPYVGNRPVEAGSQEAWSMLQQYRHREEGGQGRQDQVAILQRQLNLLREVAQNTAHMRINLKEPPM